MPRKLPPEFKRDVVTVARRGELSVNEVAADFDVAPETVRRWMRQADVDDGVKDGLTSSEQSEIVQLRRTSRRLEAVGAVTAVLQVLAFGGVVGEDDRAFIGRR